MSERELLRMENIEKKFGKVTALSDVTVTVNSEEIVGLVGDNGAGKSTLIKILSGLLKADSGNIHFKGKDVEITNSRQAIEMGIETIYQETSLVDQLTVARNIFLGREPTKGFMKRLDMDYMKAESSRLLGRIGLNRVSPDSRPPALSGGEKQSIAIARGMYFKASLLVLDEPTNHLGIEESDRVLEFVKEAKKEGTSSIFITHNIRHVYQIADRFVVLRNGKKVGDARRDETTIDEISNLITGRGTTA